MTSDQLRLILLFAGICLVIAIYLWDRRTSSNGRSSVVKPQVSRREPSLDESVGPSDETVEDAEPVSEPERAAIDASTEEESFDPFVLDQSEPDIDSAWGAADGDVKHLDADSTVNTTVELDDEPDDMHHKLPSMIIQLNVVTKGDDFSGKDIMLHAKEMDLKLGEMNILHRYITKKAKPCEVFGLASMVEPGFFPARDEIEDFSTPGLTLFAQLPGPQDGLATFSDMLCTAERLASKLNGELQDNSHHILSSQMIEHIRTQIQEFRRQLQLARNRP